MSIKQFNYNFSLQADQIDHASQQVLTFLSQLKLEKKEMLRIQLSAENTLLVWQDHFGSAATVRMSCFVRMGQPIVQFRLYGEMFDPLESDTDDFGHWQRALLAKAQTQAVYTYKRGTNTVSFHVVTPKRSPLILLLISLLLAVLVGLAGMLLPLELRTVIAGDYLDLIANTYLNVLSFFGIPLIFLSVTLGISNIEDIHVFDRIGRRMLGHYLGTLFLITLLCTVITYPFFTFVSGDSLNIVYSDLLEMILGWLPTNLLQPFISMNAMQLVLMGFFFGIALLTLSSQTKTLPVALNDLNSLLLMGAEKLTRLLPVFVFIIVVKSIWLGQLSQILPAWKSWVITTALQLAALTAMLLIVSSKYKVRLKVLAKKISATFLIALGTNSCTASIVENYACCSTKLGISGKVFGFGIPIGTSIFKPGCAIRLIVLSFFMASVHDVGVSLSWFLMTVLMAIIFSIAIPAIPGGLLMCCPLLFTQLGLPAEALTAMLATDIFFDSVCTAFNQVFVQAALLHQAGKLDMLDLDVLRCETTDHAA